MASASQADSGGFDSRFLLQIAARQIAALFYFQTNKLPSLPFCGILFPMKVFAISDLHLSGLKEKPMNIFGENWEGHFEKIASDWRAKVSAEDVVLIGGDTSWGMKLEEGMFDVARLAPLPGKKVFIRGNHDYWWNGITRVRASAPDDTFLFL